MKFRVTRAGQKPTPGGPEAASGSVEVVGESEDLEEAKALCDKVGDAVVQAQAVEGGPWTEVYAPSR